VGYHTFNVTVADTESAKDIVQFTLFIANVNDPPVLAYIGTQTTNEGEVFTMDVSTYVTDPDLLIPEEWRDHITYRDDTPKLDTNLETGIITWDKPTNEDVGDFYFKITVQDSKGRYDEQEIKITVLNVNNPPTLGTIPRQVLHQDSPYVFNIPFSDPDLQVTSAGEELTFSNDGHQLFTIDAATGRIQFTPVNNQVGIWEINITVTDVGGLSATKKVVFEVVNKNDAPELEYIKVQQLTEDTAYTLQVHAVDPDMELRLVDNLPVDPNERLEYRTNSTRVPIERDSGLIGFTPSNDDAKIGDIMVKITVIDRSSETATEDVLFKVTNVNDPPQELSIVGVVEGQQLQEGKTYQLIGSAKDIDNGAEQLTYMWYSGATVIGQTSTVQWKIKGHGATVLKLVVSDPDGGQAMYNVTVQVKAIEKSPGYGSAAALAAFVIVGVMVAAVANRRRIH
jgi:VCBS repeat-containing protein